MTLREIKDAVQQGKIVCWKHDGYRVIYLDYSKEYYIVYLHKNYVIGLTWQDGVTMNGEEQDFYIFENLKG
jgi:hypothetical protein